MELSKDEKKIKNVIKTINELETVEAIQTYIAGDDRQDVLDAAQLQIELIEKTSPSPQPSPHGGEGEEKKPADTATAPALESGPVAASDAGGPPEALGGEGAVDIAPTHDKDTTHKWIKDLRHLQPKPADVERAEQQAKAAETKGPAAPEERVMKTKIMTIRDGKPVWVHFDEEGTEIKIEPII